MSFSQLLKNRWRMFKQTYMKQIKWPESFKLTAYTKVSKWGMNLKDCLCGNTWGQLGLEPLSMTHRACCWDNSSSLLLTEEGMEVVSRYSEYFRFNVLTTTFNFNLGPPSVPLGLSLCVCVFEHTVLTWRSVQPLLWHPVSRCRLGSLPQGRERFNMEEPCSTLPPSPHPHMYYQSEIKAWSPHWYIICNAQVETFSVLLMVLQ